MIKIEKDILYMSAGETSYSLAVTDGKLVHIHFGKRVEPEDDLLFLGGAEALEFDDPEIMADGGVRKCDLIFESAEVLSEKPQGALVLGGGKTLRVMLSDRANKIRVELYYTPYSRGGYSRRAVVCNYGQAPATFGKIDNRIPVVGVQTHACDGLPGFKVLTVPGCGERTGEAYGYLCAYLDGKIECKSSGGALSCGSGSQRVTLAPGEKHCSAEILAVYSDGGIGGMSRVFHDILRENMIAGFAEKRSQTTLFLPSMPVEKAKSAAEEASKLGCDVMAVDLGEYSADEIADIASACRASGIKLGLRVTTDGIKASSAACVYGYKQTPSGCKIDKSDENAIAALVNVAEKTVTENGIRYLLFETEGTPDERLYCTAVFRMRARLAAAGPETVVEWGKTSGTANIAATLCFPPCVIRNTVECTPKAFKQRFDRATLGLLAYRFDPTSVSDGIKRAVRAQILSYQDDAPVVMNGDLYRTPDGKCSVCVSKDKAKAYVVCSVTGGARVKLVGLDEHNIYRVRELDKTFSGAALMYYGVTMPFASEPTTLTLHLRQVADYE